MNEPEHSIGGAQALFAPGLVRLADGESADVLELFLENGRRMLAGQWVNPALPPWRLLARIQAPLPWRPPGDGPTAGAGGAQAGRAVGEPGYVDRVKRMSAFVPERL